MQWLKFSLCTLLLIQSVPIFASKFSSQECLNSKYSTKIEHKGKFFGLIENKISVKKEECLIEVKFKGLLETTWKIDVCREPIHMKVVSKGSQDVYKRDKKCEKSTKSDYCYYRNELMESMQDHGLIFADGQREDIKQSHGQIFCSYLLLQRYLDDGYIFSVYENPKDIYREQSACAIPTKSENKPDEDEKTPVAHSAEKESLSHQESIDTTIRAMTPLTKEETDELNRTKKPKF